MYCYKCGTKLDDDARFCTNCGTKVSEEQEDAVPGTAGHPDFSQNPEAGAVIEPESEISEEDEAEVTKIIGELPHKYGTDPEDHVEHVEPLDASKPERNIGWGDEEGQPDPFSQESTYGRADAFGQGNPHGQSGTYGQENLYGQPGSYGQRNPYGQAGSYGQGSTYGQTDGYSQGNPYGQSEAFGHGNIYGQPGPRGQGNAYGQADSHGQGNPYGQQMSYGQGNPYGGKPYYAKDSAAVKTAPKKGLHGGVLAAIIVVGVLALCGIGFLVWSMTGGKSTPEKTISKLESAFNNKDTDAFIDVCDETSGTLLKAYLGMAENAGYDLFEELEDEYGNFKMEIMVKNIVYDGDDRCTVRIKMTVSSDKRQNKEEEEEELSMFKEKGVWKIDFGNTFGNGLF